MIRNKKDANRFKLFMQHDSLDCGATCLRMVISYYGKVVNHSRIRNLCNTSGNGSRMYDLSEAAQELGFETSVFRISPDKLAPEKAPYILFWPQNHFVILYKIEGTSYYVADPAKGLLRFEGIDFLLHWVGSCDEAEGIAMALTPGKKFYTICQDEDENMNWSFVIKYLKKYKSLLLQIFIGLAISSLISFLTPFLTQSIVDIGVNSRQVNMIYLILIAQIMLVSGNVVISFLRAWILLYISGRVNISMLSEFLAKIMRLPLRFFENRTVGDVIQRMNDQQKIDMFLREQVFNTLFSIINLVVFIVVLAYYNSFIFIISLAASLFYFLWTQRFLNKRRAFSAQQFEQASSSNNAMFEIVQGIHEIKLNNCQEQKRWRWESVQLDGFLIRKKALLLNQYQQAGGILIVQLRNILITFMSVKAVIEGQLTLGGMMAIQYIVGQVSNPLEQIIGFIQSYQDARISVERLNIIYDIDDEEQSPISSNVKFPDDKSIYIRNLSFYYPRTPEKLALDNINFSIPQGSVTAIIGTNGSGKTTLLKLLLRSYESTGGDIFIGDTALSNIDREIWRSRFGAVLPTGFIFKDTIANNISLGDNNPSPEKLKMAIAITNLSDVIADLPFGINTVISNSASGLSQGQIQRILIARAIYKEPDYFFFDEATNSLDPENEKQIFANLRKYFDKKTMVIIAHQLSTVSDADNIIVLSKGRIAEMGNHEDLIKKEGLYYDLVKSQINLNSEFV